MNFPNISHSHVELSAVTVGVLWTMCFQKFRLRSLLSLTSYYLRGMTGFFL